MKPFTNKHSIAAGSPLHLGGSKKDKKSGGDGDTAFSDSKKDGNAVSRGLDKARNFVDSQPKNSPRSNNQMFDYDNDGDTVFNDSNNDGTMLSRSLIAARNYLDPSAKQALGNKNSKKQLFDL
jgi:hypothetical protein